MTRKDSHSWICRLPPSDKASLNELIRVGCLFTVAEHHEGEVRVLISHRGGLISSVAGANLADAFREACAQSRSLLFAAPEGSRRG